jgi:hypothetical protein
MSWNLYHTESEKLAGEAEALRLRGDHSSAAEAYRRAAEFEERALEALDPSKSRTRGITAVSALSLWDKAGNAGEVHRLAKQLLAEPLPHFAQAQAREFLDAQAGETDAHEHRFEVELTLRQTLRYAVRAADRKVAEREAVERWRSSQGERVDASEQWELVAVRSQPAEPDPPAE